MLFNLILINLLNFYYFLLETIKNKKFNYFK